MPFMVTNNPGVTSRKKLDQVMEINLLGELKLSREYAIRPIGVTQPQSTLSCKPWSPAAAKMG